MTTFLDRLLGRPEPPKAAKAVTSLGPWGTSVGSLSSYSGEPQDRAKAYLRAYKVGWFYKAGRKIADDIASLDWSVSDGDMEEGEEETVLDRPELSIPFASLSPIDQFQRLIERPNPAYTGRQLLRKTQVRLDFAGAAAWYLAGASTGLPQAIYGISPARMWPSYDKQGNLIGWVMDKDAPSGGVPFDKDEILWFSTGNSDDNDIWGTSVVEAVSSQVPLTDLMARHTATVMTTGGRLAGMMWPKDRALSEDEFVDAQRAWRNVMSDPEAGKRLLIFPEPMEYAAGASTPAEIGIPDLAILNRDEILTAFPISPYQLGVPQPGGLNSGEVRREDRRDYWEGTIHPRADLLEETIQVGLLSIYENKMGQTFDFEIDEPNLDDASSLVEKTEAYKGLISIGLDPKEALDAVGLNHIKWLGLPELLDPAAQAEAAREATEALAERPAPTPPAKVKSVVEKRDAAVNAILGEAKALLHDFLIEQRDRVSANIRRSYPSAKSDRKAWAAKVDPDWWDADLEDRELTNAMRGLYVRVGRDSLQVAADTLGRFIYRQSVDRVVADLLSAGGSRIKDINARTLQALSIELAEGTRRGYSLNQLIEGVADEGYRGVLGVTLENGAPVFGDLRAETIARTESRTSYNRASIDAYAEFGVEKFLAYDGDDDEACAARNGETFSADAALAEEENEHPNGTLVFSPVVDKSYREPQNITVTPTFNLTLPETHVQVAQPDVKVFNDVQPTPVTVQNEVHSPAVSVTNEVKTPNVTVRNDVQSPSVHVEAPVVNVNKTMKLATEPVFNVTMPADLRITSMPDRLTTRVVKRDKGVITETTEVETDA